MQMRKLASILFGSCLLFYGGFYFGTKQEIPRSIQEITIDDYYKMKDNGISFALYIERPSCRYCAVVSSYTLTMKNLPLPVYYISLEPFWESDDYETVKKELETTYLPCFKYISHGEIQYNLNSPLDSSYYNLDGPGRMELYRQMQDRIDAFLNGAAGQGPVIDETPASDGTVKATPIKNEDTIYD